MLSVLHGLFSPLGLLINDIPLGRDLVGYSREFNITGSVKEEMRQVTETPKVTLKNQLVHIGSANIVPQA